MPRLKTLALAAGACIVAAGALAAANAGAIRARLADRNLRAAADDESRTAYARQLVALGEPGAVRAATLFAEPGADAGRALAKAVAEAPPGPARAALLAASGRFHPDHAEAALELVPAFLESPNGAEAGRPLVKAGLAASAPAARVAAVRLALRPDVSLTADVVPLLRDPSAEVRRAAMLAVGPASDTPLVDDESLFAWLHDADAEVRDLCEAALKSRGLDGPQVDFARKLASPDAADRLGLLLDLGSAGADVVRDAGPWLERLSRDAEPAVRAGAARAAHERGLRFAGWAERLASADADAAVRALAGYYRRQAGEVRGAGYGE